MSDDDLMIHTRHLKGRLCNRGARLWFNAVGLDWNDFVTNGVSAARLRATGDVLCESTIEVARIERDGK
jgi:hypothetical protein